MIDRIPLTNGRNNKVKFDLSGIGSWAEFVAKNAAGELRADVFANNDGDGTDEIGTPLSKATLLSDDTASMLGFDDLKSVVPDEALQRLTALASSGGGSAAVSELEDFEIEIGVFNNAGAGFNTKSFKRAFTSTPAVAVFADSTGFTGWVVIGGVNASSFQYCLRVPSGGGATASTTTIYSAAGTSYNSNHSAVSVVNGVTSVPASSTTTGTIYQLRYIAVAFGGER